MTEHLPSNGVCPTDDFLMRSACGRSTPHEEQILAEHLPICAACQRRFDQFLFPADEVTAMRAAYGDKSAAQTSDLQSRVRALGTAWRPQGQLVEYADSLSFEAPRDGRFQARLGAFDIVRPLGRGGMGFVFLAFDERLQRNVAIKLMSPVQAADSVAAERFLREARAAARLQHPNVVTIYDVDVHAHVPYFVMEFVEGPSLAGMLDRDGPLPPERTIRLAIELLAALGHAHAEGLIHRDVKPANVLYSERMKLVKLADFGLARSVGDLLRYTAEGTACGTPWYMAPEQAAGQRALDARCDLFAVGVVLFETLTGELPFPGPDRQAVMRDIRELPAPDLREFRDGLPDSLAQIVSKALEKAPDQRYQTAAQFTDALRAILARGTADTAACGPRPTAEQERPTCQLPGCRQQISIGSSFHCTRCERRMCTKHEDPSLPAYCEACAETVRDQLAFDTRLASAPLPADATAVIAALLQTTQAKPSFEARIWTERGDCLATRDLCAVPRRSGNWFQIGQRFTLHAQSERDCCLTLLEMGSSGKLFVVLHNHRLRAGRPVALSGPDEAREWIVGGPAGVERIKAFFTGQPLRLEGGEASFRPLANTEMARDILSRIKHVESTLYQMPPDSWTDATCEFVVESACGPRSDASSC